jgi:hypothetical protein
MTGPIARVTCPKCGRLFARKRDGTPFVHGCDLIPEIRMADHPTPDPKPVPKPRKPERAEPDPDPDMPTPPKPEPAPPAQPALRLRLEK